ARPRQVRAIHRRRHIGRRHRQAGPRPPSPGRPPSARQDPQRRKGSPRQDARQRADQKPHHSPGRWHLRPVGHQQAPLPSHHHHDRRRRGRQPHPHPPPHLLLPPHARADQRRLPLRRNAPPLPRGKRQRVLL